MSGRTSWVGSRVARGQAPRDFPRATRIALTSVLLGGLDGWFAIAPEAWRQSAVKTWLDQTVAPLDTAHRVRLTGVGILSAAVTHALLGASTLLHSWRALLVWALASAIGLVLVAASGPLAVAWRSHR